MALDNQRAKSLFLTAADLPVEERGAFLDEACAGEAELRRRVEQLLAAHDRPDSLSEASPDGGPTQDSHPDVGRAPAGPTEGPGTMIGPYKLLQQLGEGGMGAVYLAEQSQPVRRLVALKIIKPGMDSAQVIARFEAERQALALMDHPNVAKVLDGDTTESGRPFFAMELVKGVPITKFCDERRLTLRQRLELFVPVCQAVQHAHQKGVIHRDLKPSNVMVCLYDGKPVPKVIDFGIAKATGPKLTERTMFTEIGQVVGTLEYMSPEQAELNQLDVDTRSDIYSLGVLLYELLTGSTPLESKRLKTAGLLEALRRIREEESPPPSTRLSESADTLPAISAQRQTEPARLTKLVRGELDWIAMKALDKDRSRRYETASALAADVQRYLADEPVLACPPSAWYRLRKFLRRNKGPVVAVSLMALLLTAGIVGTTMGLIWALAEKRQVVQERDDKEAARKETLVALNMMTDEVVEELLGTQVKLTDKHRAFLKKVLEYHAAFAAAKVDDPEGCHSRAGGFFRVGRIRFDLGELKEAETPYREALALQKQLAEEFPDRLDYRHDLGQTHRYLGQLLHSLKRTKEAEAEYTEVIRIGKQLVAESNQAQFRADLAIGIHDLGALLLLDTDRQKEGERLLRDSLAVSEQLMREFPDVADYYHGVFAGYSTLGMLLKDTKRPKEAEKVCRKAVDLSRRLPAKFRDRPEFRHELASIYVSLGILLQSTGRPREAVDAWREAVRLDKQLAKEFPVRSELRHRLASSENNLGKLLHNSRREAEAEKVWSEALELYKQLAEEVPSRSDYRYGEAIAYHNMGSVLYGTNRRKEAEEAWRKAVELGKELVHEYPTKDAYRGRLVLSYGHVALMLSDTGRPAQAEKAWREILKLTKEMTHDVDMAATYNYFGQELETVRAPLDRIITIYRESLRLDKANANTHYRLGNALKAAHQPDRAVQEYREALLLQKDFPEVHVNLGNILVDRNELDRAIAEYREALATRHKFPEVYKAHYGLGNALMAKGKPGEAVAAYKKALRLNNKFAPAHYSLGNAYFPHRLKEAITAYRAAIGLNKNYAEAHTNLGNSLAVKGDLDEAIREYRTALGINKDLFEAHLGLGVVLRHKGQLEDAVRECQAAIRLRKEHASGHSHLGLTWVAKGKLKEALAEFREAHRLEKNNARAKANLRQAERMVQLQERLPAVLEGKDKPKDTAELIGFAQLCRPPFQPNYTAATVRFFRAAFGRDPKLAEDLLAEHRYNAACSAALAGCGQGKDAAKIDDKERIRLRRQALDWLRADLDAWGRWLNKEPDKVRPVMIHQLRHWLEDTDFAGVRGPQALAKLPDAERQPWQKLWDDIASTLSRIQARTVPRKKSDPR
jgi:serine/threonine protein kinase/Tfp pilus assembly protein PilF